MKKIIILFGACGLLSVGAENAYAKTKGCRDAMRGVGQREVGPIARDIPDHGDSDGHQRRVRRGQPKGQLISVSTFGPSTRPVRADSTVGQP
jgi:hypothetical protein